LNKRQREKELYSICRNSRLSGVNVIDKLNFLILSTATVKTQPCFR